ncbi:2TM domain-containing protein [Flavobacterium sp. C4GT6]|uniref:2TM domain-containing protein n=1 Tax=Flavobacterium sp. C4GT6 TaxID=3103818 RepID=UPI002ED49C93
MENTFQENLRVERARKRVKAIKGFYRHLVVYMCINAFILVMHYINMDPGQSFWEWHTFSTAIPWGIGLLLHGVSVFGRNVFFGSNWEERKINEIMEQNKKRKSENRWE